MAARSVLLLAQVDTSGDMYPPPWFLSADGHNGATWGTNPAQVAIQAAAAPFLKAGLQPERLPPAGWKFAPASGGLHGHHPTPDRIVRYSPEAASAIPGDDAAADLEALVRQRLAVLAADGRAIYLTDGAGFGWAGLLLRLELPLAPLRAAGVDPQQVAGWRHEPAADGRPERLVHEVYLR